MTLLLSPCRVVVADDDARIRRHIRAILERMGAEVDEAADGGALRALLLRAHAHGLVITDLEMPRFTGTAVIHGMRARGDLTPAIVLSGNGRAARAAVSGLQGVRVLGKPFILDAFERAVATSRVARVSEGHVDRHAPH